MNNETYFENTTTKGLLQKEFWFGAQFNSMHNFTQSIRISFPGSRNWVSCQTQSLWLNNAVQCRRLTGSSSVAAATWTHEGTYLIYGFLASIIS